MDNAETHETQPEPLTFARYITTNRVERVMTAERIKKSVLLWQGPSELTDEPIVVLASGILDLSVNAKTGTMVQVYFLRADIAPGKAVAAKDTRAICGECAHAPHRDGTCYVNPAFGPTQLWLSWQRGDVPALDPSAWHNVFHDRYVRIGAYGDPAAAPDRVALDLAAASRGHTGYTHAWRDRPALKAVCMASVGSDAERQQAEAQGWRAFQVVAMNRDTLTYLEPVSPDVVICGASEERDKRTSCVECGACGGLASKAKASIAIGAHGVRIHKHAGVRGLGRDARRYPKPESQEQARAGGSWGFVP